MNITAQLKAHMVKHFGLPESAADDDTRKLVGEKLASGELALAEYQTLTKSAGQDSALDRLADSVAARVFGAGGPILTVEDATKALAARGSGTAMVKAATNPAHDVMMGGVGTGTFSSPRVKSVAEMYDRSTKSASYDQSDNEFLKKNFGGRPVMSQADGEGAHALSHPSQFDLAISGAWFKYAALSTAKSSGQALRMRMTEHDMQLVSHAIHEMPFTGSCGKMFGSEDGAFGFNNRRLYPHEIKSLFDDALSGGLEAAPIVFDDAVILTPLLHGEFFPFVNLVTVTRGRRIEAFSMGNPTFQWGISEGTSIPMFNTDGFIAAFDNTIHVATGAMGIGLDFEEDSPTNIGQLVVQRYGDAAKKTLDYVVVLGDGLTQPQGFFNAPGTAAIPSENGGSGPLTLGDFSGLQFGVTKEFRERSCIYASNDTTYQRSRNLKVDPSVTSTDERRIMGMDMQSYNTLGYQHKINASIPNNKVGFFDPRRFRMYRRAGLSVVIERAGQSLVLSNQQLIVCRMRFGGALELGGAAAFITDGQN